MLPPGREGPSAQAGPPLRGDWLTRLGDLPLAPLLAAAVGEAAARPWAGETIGLWRVHLDAARLSAADLARLCDAERERAARFVFERDRQRHLVSCAAVRCVLADVGGETLARQPFVRGPQGKPALPGPRARPFNLSHSGGWALIALMLGLDGQAGAAPDLGVDLELEPEQEMVDLDALAEAHFSIAEREELARTPQAQRSAAFLRGWTRKEACLKAVGSGLSVPADSFHAGLADHPGPAAVTVVHQGRPWRLGVTGVEVAPPTPGASVPAGIRLHAALACAVACAG